MSTTSTYPTIPLRWRWLLPLVAVATIAIEPIEVSRKCSGPFSAAFSAEFDRVHCRLVLRYPARDAEMSILLPLAR
jgi:hypothetical protein